MSSKHPAEGGKMPAGGSEFATETIACDRCGDPATRTWEGRDFLQLCELCHDDLGRWLES